MGKTARRGGAKSSKAKGGRSTKEPAKSAKGRRSAAWRGCGGDLAGELAAMGLRVKEISADGNCFFHALEDQLGGEEGDFVALRRRVMDHIAAHKEEFAPFVEDDEPFQDYVQRMREDGVWGGNLEVQAASMAIGVNIMIYQAGQAAWTVKNFPEANTALVLTMQTAPLLHIAYEDGCHYNSVRLAADHGSGTPQPIAPATLMQSQGSAIGHTQDEAALREVLAGTGCEDRCAVEAALLKCHGSAADAIEWLIRMAGEEEAEKDGASQYEATASAECAQEGSKPESVGGCWSGELPQAGGGGGVAEQEEGRVEVHCRCDAGAAGAAGRVQVELRVVCASHRKAAKLRKSKKDAAGPPNRNARCPCGSKRKYKNCCGAAAAARKRADPRSDCPEAPALASALQVLYI